MLSGMRLRLLREQKGLSQAAIEAKTGLMRCYLSRIENGHTVPSLETLERIAGALEVSLYQVFRPSESEALPLNLSRRKSLEELAEQDGKPGEEARFLLHLKALWNRLAQPEREILLGLARKMANPETAVPRPR